MFCEKPFVLDGRRRRASWRHCAEPSACVTQVGYHNRFVGAFPEVKRLLDAGAIGTVTHVLAEAYGRSCCKPKGGTWRSRQGRGRRRLYDYAGHALNLLNWYCRRAASASAAPCCNAIFSREIDDEVYSTLYYRDGAQRAQLSRQLVRRVATAR